MAEGIPSTFKAQAFHAASLQRSADKPQRCPSPVSSQSRPPGSSSAHAPAAQDSSATVLERLRTSFEQSFRSATRSKPPAGDGEFGTITAQGQGQNINARRKGASASELAMEKGGFTVLKRLEKKAGLRYTERQSSIHSSTPISYTSDSKEHVDNADKASARVAGWRSFMSPSLAEATVSSPTLHPLHQALSLQNPQPAAMFSSPSTPGFMSPWRNRTRRPATQPTTPNISAPLPLVPRRGLRNDAVLPECSDTISPRARRRRLSPISSLSTRPSLDTPDRNRDLPTPPASPNHLPGSRGQPPKHPRQPGSASASQVTLSILSASPVRGRTVSPTQANFTSDSSGLSTSQIAFGGQRVDPPDRPSSETLISGLVDTTTSRTVSPVSIARSCMTSPSNCTSAQPHTRPGNASTVSIPSPSTPEQRELLRLATSFLCKELRKPPYYLSRPDRQRDWTEVEVRLQPLMRVERMWGKSSAISRTTFNQSMAISLGSTVINNAGEERERKLFHDALRDGVVLCYLMNKHRPGVITRVGVREDGSKRVTNITKFLAACSSQGMCSDDLFHRDDLIEATPESLCRVARTILALLKLFDAPAIGENRVTSGQRKIDRAVTRSDSSAHFPTSQHRPAALSSPDYSLQRPFSPTQVAPSRKLWSVPVFPDASGSGTSNDTAQTLTRTNSGHRGDACPMFAAQSPPPKSPFETPPRSKLASESSANPFLTLRLLEFPQDESDSQCASPIMMDLSGDGLARQSRTSSNITENTAYSSLFDFRRNSAQGRFGTIKTVTTVATSLGSEVPSFSQTEGISLAEEMGKWRGASVDMAKAAERRLSEPAMPDLVSLAEEEESSACGCSSRGTHRHRPRDPAPRASRLGNGKWPGDFLDDIHAASPPWAISGGASPDVLDTLIAPSSLTTSPGRMSSIIIGPNSTADSAILPRRPSTRNGHGVDMPVLMPKESVFRTDVSLDNSTGGGPRVALRRQSTRVNTLRRNGMYMPRGMTDNGEREPIFSAIPFPRVVSGEYSVSSSSTPDIACGRERSSSRDVSRMRGRFQSDMDDPRTRKRSSLPSSYDELGRSRRSSDRLRDSMEGSGIRQTIIVTEEGEPPVHYQLGNCIGRGQFGTVYRALNMSTGQMVAVKRIRLEGLREDEVTQLMDEVDLMKSLSHPSIVKYEGMVRDEDSLNIVLEYAESGSLGQTLKAFGTLNEHLVANYVVKILEGLHYLHTCQVVHCDLKAANILTTKSGNVKLSDFGVSLNLRAMQKEMMNVAGTPNWMAPEVIELKGPSTKADIWSLGCTVIELLTGRPPYGDIANTMTVMFRIVEDDMPPLPEGCSDALQDFLQECFHKNPELRPDAETLCEHPWLTSNWDAFKELRPQDSIPFLRRVSVDLQKADATKLRAHINIPMMESMTAETMIPPQPGPNPPKRRPSVAAAVPSPVIPDDTPFTPRDHTFVKTTFGRPVVCRVCLGSVKKSGLICDQCNLVAHAQCTLDAQPTCDLRTQLLQYAQYAEMNPLSVPSTPADVSHGEGSSVLDNAAEMHKEGPHGMSSSLPSVDSPSAPGLAPVHKTTSGFKFVGGFGRSRSSLSTRPPSSSSHLPAASASSPLADGRGPRRVMSRLVRAANTTTDSRPHSLSSTTSTAPKSMQTGESRSSRYDPSSRSFRTGSERDTHMGTLSRLTTAADSMVVASRNPVGGIMFRKSGPQKKHDKSSNCVVQ